MTTRRLAIVLVRPREAGNVGMVCRAMANMGLSELRIVEPATELGDEARMFAVGARHVLEGAERFDSLATALAPFRRVVGTTSARDRRLSVPVVTPRELPEVLASDPSGPEGETPAALLFGSEVGGLTNDELALCSPVVIAPCAPEQPTLNLAQAVLLVTYELYVTLGAGAGGPPLLRDPAEPVATREPPATASEVEGLFGHLEGVLGRVGFARDTTFRGVMRDLRQLASRAAPTDREVTILRGILRRIENAFERRGA